MPGRRRRLDHALKTPQRGIWIATVAILLLGLAVIVWSLSQSERRRMAALERIEPGDDSQRVVQVLGEPVANCAADSLSHLRGQFPPGWPPAIIEQAIERLEQETVQRWVYPLELGDEVNCAFPARATDIGFDQDQRVLWYIPVTGKQPLALPIGFTPASFDPENEADDG